MAQNWRSDQSGKLVSRFGYPQKFAISSMAYAHSGACSGGVDGDFYIAANAASGGNPCAIYKNPNSLTTPIVTGLSGGRVGMVPMNGYMWVMDPTVQGRHNLGSGVWTNWGIEPPTTGEMTSFAAAAGTAHVGGPSGSYSFYCTFISADNSYETNPGPIVATVSVTDEDVDFTGLPTRSGDPLLPGGSEVNIYASGGGLGSPYLVQHVPIGTTTASWNTSDLAATADGIKMPTDHDLPPAGAGMVGPYFGRLYSWSKSRLFYTDANLPQYWPGAHDDAVGNWVNVGSDGEDIVWCTIHPNVLVIYKERSIWYLAGDPDTGTLERLEDGTGLVNPWAVVAAGAFDYFVAPGSLRRCNVNLGRTEDVSGELRPLFTSRIQNTGPLTTPGSILVGPSGHSLDVYAIALGYAMGKLYVSYGENVASGTSTVLLVYNEQEKRWVYHRNGMYADRFYGFLFDGVMMQGLTGRGGIEADGWNLDDFRVFYTEDQAAGTTPARIECVYQSHYEDCGLPDNEKVWLELVIDYVINSTDTANVSIGIDNLPLANIGTLTATAGLRKQTSFPLGANGTQAKNIAVGFYSLATATVEVHNVYLYYYTEARLALAAASIPTDLGSASVKQCKELMLDIDATGGAVDVNLLSDLPGNALASRQTPTVASGGRAIWKYPFSVTEGYLWKLVLNAAAGPFRLYSARLLMRPIGTYVEAYEAAAGFVWDSMEQTFESGLTHIPRMYAIALAASPIKRFREISLDIDTFNEDVTLDFITDLPDNEQTVRQSFTVNSGSTGRRFVRLPLPAGINAPVEGRICRIKISGIHKFILYGCSVEVLAMGVYIEPYEADAGAVYDSRELDFGSAKVKEAREIELDIAVTGSADITATLYSDLPGYNMASVFTTATVTTTGREKVLLPLPQGTAPFTYPLGRLFQLILTGSEGYALYGARLRVRELGCYITGDEAAADGLYDSTPLDLGTERVKDFKYLELDCQTDGSDACTLKLYTNQNGTLEQQFTTTVGTSDARRTVRIPLTPGIRGRLVQIILTSGACRLFAGRVWWRTTNDPKAEWAWTALPIEPTTPEFHWVPFPLEPTPPTGTPAQWFWAKVLSVAETPDTWTWVDVPATEIAA